MNFDFAAKAKRCAASLLVMLLMACAPTLAGQLVSMQGEPVVSDNARINIAPLDRQDAGEGGKNTLILTVDRQGRFATENALAPGEYLVEALVPGYSIAASRIKIEKSKDAPRPALTLTLSALGPTPTKSTSANLEADDARGSGGASLTPPNF